MKLSQCEKILVAMLSNKDKQIWIASDFQRGDYFIGYEASARMSDLVKMYPDLFIVSKVGRFRALEINWEQKELIDFLRKMLSDE